MGVAPDSARLLEIEPDLTRLLNEDDLALIEQVRVPVRRPPRGAFAMGRVTRPDDFGVMVLDGMVFERVCLAGHVTMRLFGPGDLLPSARDDGSMLVTNLGLSAAADTRLAVLGREMLAALHHWPALAAALHVRACEQSARFAVQLAICQLPRVEDRVLSVLWWLAESWGRVTPAGTVLPISLTHDVLGALVGARRPTITLALGELSARGALVRQDQGWLLLDPPPAGQHEPAELLDPALIASTPSHWQPVAEEGPSHEVDHITLLETVSRLREEHAVAKREVQERLVRMNETRERIAEQRRGRR